MNELIINGGWVLLVLLTAGVAYAHGYDHGKSKARRVYLRRERYLNTRRDDKESPSAARSHRDCGTCRHSYIDDLDTIACDHPGGLLHRAAKCPYYTPEPEAE